MNLLIKKKSQPRQSCYLFCIFLIWFICIQIISPGTFSSYVLKFDLFTLSFHYVQKRKNWKEKANIYITFFDFRLYLKETFCIMNRVNKAVNCDRWARDNSRRKVTVAFKFASTDAKLDRQFVYFSYYYLY